MKYLSKLRKQVPHQIHATNKGRRYVHENFLLLSKFFNFFHEKHDFKQRIHTVNKVNAAGQGDQL